MFSNRTILAGLLVLLLAAEPVMAAVSCSTLTQGQDTTNATSFATASVTPGANNLILFGYVASRNISTACSTIEANSVTGNSLTWVSVNRQCFSDAGAPTMIVELYRSMGASPSTGAVSFGFASTRVNAAWVIVECSGVDTSGTNGSGAVAQSAVNLVEPGTSLTVTLSAFGSANNATFGLFGLVDNLTITPGSGFTELAEQIVTEGGTDAALQAEWKTGNDTTVDASWSSIDAGGVAIEIKAAATTTTAEEALWFQ